MIEYILMAESGFFGRWFPNWTRRQRETDAEAEMKRLLADPVAYASAFPHSRQAVEAGGYYKWSHSKCRYEWKKVKMR